jgi:hypothetical protein
MLLQSNLKAGYSGSAIEFRLGREFGSTCDRRRQKSNSVRSRGIYWITAEGLTGGSSLPGVPVPADGVLRQVT